MESSYARSSKRLCPPTEYKHGDGSTREFVREATVAEALSRLRDASTVKISGENRCQDCTITYGSALASSHIGS